jgi:hypothetical protein
MDDKRIGHNPLCLPPLGQLILNELMMPCDDADTNEVEEGGNRKSEARVKEGSRVQ